MIYVIYAFLVFVSFLVTLNEFLRGGKKAQIDAFLGILLACLVIASFIVAGWKTGLAAIVVTFLSAKITRPFAARIASKLFSLSGGWSGRFIGLPLRPLELISRELGRPFVPKKFMKEILQHGGSRPNAKEKAKETLLDYCVANTEIRKVMNEFSISRDDLRELYSDLIAIGAGQWRCGHWVAASALAYPQTLRYILEGQAKGREKKITVLYLIMYFERGSPLSD
jgi:hypothetical protein